MTDNALTIAIKRTALQVFPDTARYKYRFTIRSSSSNKQYMISFDQAPNAGYWTCSCPGNIRFGHCKHLEAMGLQGRKYGQTTLAASLKRSIG